MFQKILSIVAVVLIVAGAAVGILYAMGRIAVVIKDPGDMYMSVSRVCDAGVVNSYNEAAEYQYRGDDAAEPTMDTDALVRLGDEITAKTGQDQDPTCQTILFWNAIEERDESSARAALTRLQELNKAGLYPDNNLRASAPLFEYGTAIESLSNEPVDGVMN